MSGLEECRCVFDGLISSVQNICVRCRNVNDIIRSSFLDIIPDLLQS